MRRWRILLLRCPSSRCWPSSRRRCPPGCSTTGALVLGEAARSRRRAPARAAQRDTTAAPRRSLSRSIPPQVRAAFLAAEDHRFHGHLGVSPTAMLRAVEPEPEGGPRGRRRLAPSRSSSRARSCPRPRTFLGKAQEALWAMRLEAHLTQGRDPHPVPEPHSLREQHLRARGGLAALLRQARRAPLAGPGGDAGVDSPRAHRVRSLPPARSSSISAAPGCSIASRSPG